MMQPRHVISPRPVTYRGYAEDRLGDLPTRRTQVYATWGAAQEAAERLCARWFSGDRGRVRVAALPG